MVWTLSKSNVTFMFISLLLLKNKFLLQLAGTWDELAQSLEFDKSITISKIDCTEYRSICKDFDVKGYPTL